MEPIPLSQIFFLTDHEWTDFSAANWLSEVDDAVVERVIEGSDIFFEGVGDSSRSDSSEAPFESVDYLTLCYMMAEKELKTDSSQLSDETKENCLKGLGLFALYEKLRRKGFVSFCGIGKVTEFSEGVEEIELTEIGKVVGGSIKTMMQLSEAMVED